LTDYILIEDRLDFLGLRKPVMPSLVGVLQFFPDDVVTEFDAFVADKDRRPGNQLPNLVLALAAKRAIEELSLLVLAARVIAHTESPLSLKINLLRHHMYITREL
jgi:hypothetical protein